MLAVPSTCPLCQSPPRAWCGLGRAVPMPCPHARAGLTCLCVPAAAPGAGEGRAGERGAAGVRQRRPAADRRPLPRHPGAGGQRPGGVLLTPPPAAAAQGGQAQPVHGAGAVTATSETRHGAETSGAPWTKRTKAKEPSENNTLSRFFQSVIDQPFLYSSSHCLSALESSSPLTLLVVTFGCSQAELFQVY